MKDGTRPILKAIFKAIPIGLGYLAGHIASFHVKKYELKNGRDMWLPVLAALGVLVGAHIFAPKTGFETGAALKVLVTGVDASIPKDNGCRNYLGIHPPYMIYWNVEKDKQKRLLNGSI